MGLQSCCCLHISSNSYMFCNSAYPHPPPPLKFFFLWAEEKFHAFYLRCSVSLWKVHLSVCVNNLSSASHNHPQIFTSSCITDQICWYITCRAASLSSNRTTIYILTFFQLCFHVLLFHFLLINSAWCMKSWSLRV